MYDSLILEEDVEVTERKSGNSVECRLGIDCCEIILVMLCHGLDPFTIAVHVIDDILCLVER